MTRRSLWQISAGSTDSRAPYAQQDAGTTVSGVVECSGSDGDDGDDDMVSTPAMNTYRTVYLLRGIKYQVLIAFCETRRLRSCLATVASTQQTNRLQKQCAYS